MIHTDGTPTIAHKAADVILEGERLAREIPALTDYPEGSLPVFGDVLPNGATVIEAKHVHGAAVVLARTDREYVTWSLRYRDRACFSGHYERDLSEAVKDYEQRA